MKQFLFLFLILSTCLSSCGQDSDRQKDRIYGAYAKYLHGVEGKDQKMKGVRILNIDPTYYRTIQEDFTLSNLSPDHPLIYPENALLIRIYEGVEIVESNTTKSLEFDPWAEINYISVEELYKYKNIKFLKIENGSNGGTHLIDFTKFPNLIEVEANSSNELFYTNLFNQVPNLRGLAGAPPELPQCLCETDKLEWLKNGNSEMRIPDCLKGVKNLKYLKTTGLKDSNVWNISSLEALHFYRGFIDSNMHFRNLKNLRFFFVQEADRLRLDESYGQLDKLECFVTVLVDTIDFPREINWENLEYMQFSGPYIERFPDISNSLNFFGLRIEESPRRFSIDTIDVDLSKMNNLHGFHLWGRSNVINLKLNEREGIFSCSHQQLSLLPREIKNRFVQRQNYRKLNHHRYNYGVFEGEYVFGYNSIEAKREYIFLGNDSRKQQIH